MSNLRHRLQQKLAENNQRHQQAQQDSGFDAGRHHVCLPVAHIKPNPFQPRRRFDEHELAALAQSIEENGLLQPITVRQVGADGHELVAGERRLRAHQLLGRTRIEAVVITVSEADMAVLALTENISRADLTDFEIGQALRRIEHEFPSRTRLAEAVGLNREDMYRYFAFEALPASILTQLAQMPHLLGRAAASDIKKALGPRPSKTMLKRLELAFDLLAAGQLEQKRVAAFVQAKNQQTATPQRQVLSSGSVQVGTCVVDGQALRLTLKRTHFSDAQVQRLQAFVQTLLDEAGPGV